MADLNQPTLSSLYADMLNILKDRDVSAIKWLDGSTDSNIPSGAKRWNSTNNYFEKFNGTSWSILAAKYMINVDTVDGCTVNDLGTSASDLWTASKITTALSSKLDSATYTASDVLAKIKTVDGTTSGLDADLLDGMHAASTNTVTTVVARDASGNFSAGTITANLTGTASTSTTLTGLTASVAELNYSDGVTSNIQAQLNGKLGSTSKATDSALLNGIADSTGPTANTIVKRDGYGEIFAVALNTTVPDTTNTASHYYVETGSDGYLRPKTLANVKAEITEGFAPLVSPTLTTPIISGKSVNPYISLSRIAYPASGIEWYSPTYNAWCDYMGNAGTAGQGPKGNITPPVGTLVTTWGKRSFIENTPGYGWTFESAVDTATSPNIVAEIRSSDGAANFGGVVTAPSFTGTLTGNASTATSLATARTIATSGDVTGTATSFNGSANISIPMTLANSGVTAGTYSKVTVDAKGRVTTGLIPTMEDIPDATFKRSVRVATTANISLSGTQTIDGIAVGAGDRVLVKDQSTASQNGIYVVNASTWTRALDANTSSKIASALVAVDSGTSLGGKLFNNDFKTTDTLDTTPIIWNTNLDDGSLVTSGTTSIGMIKYNGTTAASGQFDGGTSTPSGTARLNYGGYFYPTYINLTGSSDTTTASSHYYVETGSDGYIRPKTLANVKAEITEGFAPLVSPTLTTPIISGRSVNPYISLSMSTYPASGIEWYSHTINAWCDYMGNAGTAGQGPKGNITPPVGTLVTTWGKRSFLENTPGYGWTFESGTYNATSPNIVAEIRSSDGAANFGGVVTAPSFTGTLTGNASTATTLQTPRAINGTSFNGSADIKIESTYGTTLASAATVSIGAAGTSDTIIISGITDITSFGTASSIGMRRIIRSSGNFKIIASQGTIVTPDGANILMSNSSVIEVVAVSTTSWVVINDGITPFLSNKVAAGYQKLPGGMILQWFNFNTSTAGNTAYNFPIVFPTACIMAVQGNKGTSQTKMFGISTFSNVSVTINTADTTQHGYILAIGY